MARIAVSGSSGFIGSELGPALSALGHEVVSMVRPGSARAGQTPDAEGVNGIAFDPLAGKVDVAALAQCDAVIHLAGAPVAQRWSDRVRQEIMDSRANGTQAIADALNEIETRVPVISASGIGIYADRGEEWLDETSEPGDSFLADVVRAWEKPWDSLRDAGNRVVALRLPMVLDPAGGALVPILRAVRFGVAGRVGSGQQWQSWIARQDVVSFIVYAVQELLADQAMPPVVNLVAPECVRQKDMIAGLAQAFSRPAWAPLPTFAVKLMFGAMGEELLLSSARVRSIHMAGFQWQPAFVDFSSYAKSLRNSN